MTSTAFSIGTPVGRWAGIGPYYAMFPVGFAFDVVQTYSLPGQAVLDPFAGRASSVYAAAATGRRGLGIEINPVGWLYGTVKLQPAGKDKVLARVDTLAAAAAALRPDAADALPEFYRHCFTPQVLRFLLAARGTLRWRTNRTDATVMALLLVNLHGKEGQAFSNQMRQGKSMSPDYSIRWWRDHRLTPPDIDPQAFLRQRIEWRYAKGLPVLNKGTMVLGDSRTASQRLMRRIAAGQEDRFQLLFTSPPYYAVTNYHYDQWLRLWMLGGPPRPTRLSGPYQKKFESREAYQRLLAQVFARCAQAMSDEATVYVRTDARPFTYQTTVDVLSQAFPGKSMTTVLRPFRRQTQTALFGDKAEKPGEVDIILS